MKNVCLWFMIIAGTLFPVKALDNYVKEEYNLKYEDVAIEWTSEHEEAVKEIDRLMVDLFDETWGMIE